MGDYANSMWLPIGTAALTGGIIIARFSVPSLPLDYMFYEEEEGNGLQDEGETDAGSESAANQEEIFDPAGVQIATIVHHFAFDLVVAILVLQMVYQLYIYQRKRGSTNSQQQNHGVNHAGIAYFIGGCAFLVFFGKLLVAEIIETKVPLIFSYLPILMYISTTAYCILQSFISYRDLLNSGNFSNQITTGTLHNRLLVYARLICTGLVALLAATLSLTLLTEPTIVFGLDILSKLLGAVVCTFFLTYIPVFKTMPLCVRGNQRSSNVSAINPAVISTVNPAIGPAVKAAGAAQNPAISTPPGYSEVCGNQPGHHTQMGPVGQTWHNPPPTGQNMEELSGQTAPGWTAAAGQNHPGVTYNSHDTTHPDGVTYDPYAATGYPTRRQTKVCVIQ